MVGPMAKSVQAALATLPHRPGKRGNLDIVKIDSESGPEAELGKAAAPLRQTAFCIFERIGAIACRCQFVGEAFNRIHVEDPSKQICACYAFARRRRVCGKFRETFLNAIFPEPNDMLSLGSFDAFVQVKGTEEFEAVPELQNIHEFCRYCLGPGPVQHLFT